MQNAGHQYGQGAVSSHTTSPFVHADVSQSGGTTSSLRQFRKKDNGEKQPISESSSSSVTENSSHVARVAPHNHFPPRPSEYYRYPQYPEYSLPPTQVKYSEIAEPQYMHHVDNLPLAIAKQKGKEYMDMCNVQQAHMKPTYPDHHPGYSTEPIHAHTQYLHKDPTQMQASFKPESQYYSKDQYQQMQKYNMTPQPRKFQSENNDFLSKLTRLNPVMAKSIMTDFHIRESQPSYPPMDQNRLYQQSQRYHSSSMQPQNYPHNYGMPPQHYNYTPSCSYKPEYSRTHQMPRYPPTIPSHIDRSLSPRRTYSENLQMSMNYAPMPQKISPNYPQYNTPEYAQHYQHRRNSIQQQEYYQQHCRPSQYIPSHQMSPEVPENRAVTISQNIKQYIETWADEDAPSSELNQLDNRNLRAREDGTNTETILMINASELQYLENGGIPLVAAENGIPISSENAQYFLKNVDTTSGVVRIVDNKDNSNEPVDKNDNRVVNLHIVEAPKNDCMLTNETPNDATTNGGTAQEISNSKVFIHSNTLLQQPNSNPINLAVAESQPLQNSVIKNTNSAPADQESHLASDEAQNFTKRKETVDKNCSPINMEQIENNLEDDKSPSDAVEGETSTSNTQTPPAPTNETTTSTVVTSTPETTPSKPPEKPPDSPPPPNPPTSETNESSSKQNTTYQRITVAVTDEQSRVMIKSTDVAEELTEDSLSVTLTERSEQFYKHMPIIEEENDSYTSDESSETEESSSSENKESEVEEVETPPREVEDTSNSDSEDARDEEVPLEESIAGENVENTEIIAKSAEEESPKANDKDDEVTETPPASEITEQVAPNNDNAIKTNISADTTETEKTQKTQKTDNLEAIVNKLSTEVKSSKEENSYKFLCNPVEPVVNIKRSRRIFSVDDIIGNNIHKFREQRERRYSLQITQTFIDKEKEVTNTYIPIGQIVTEEENLNEIIPIGQTVIEEEIHNEITSVEQNVTEGEDQNDIIPIGQTVTEEEIQNEITSVGQNVTEEENQNEIAPVGPSVIEEERQNEIIPVAQTITEEENQIEMEVTPTNSDEIKEKGCEDENKRKEEKLVENCLKQSNLDNLINNNLKEDLIKAEEKIKDALKLKDINPPKSVKELSKIDEISPTFDEETVDYSKVDEIPPTVDKETEENIITSSSNIFQQPPEIEISPPSLENEKTLEENTITSSENIPSKTLDDSVPNEVQYRSAIRVEESSVLLHIGGELVEIHVNIVNGKKLITVVPISDSALVDFNDNYETTEENFDESSDKQENINTEEAGGENDLEIVEESNFKTEEMEEEVLVETNEPETEVEDTKIELTELIEEQSDLEGSKIETKEELLAVGDNEEETATITNEEVINEEEEIVVIEKTEPEEVTFEEPISYCLNEEVALEPTELIETANEITVGEEVIEEEEINIKAAETSDKANIFTKAAKKAYDCDLLISNVPEIEPQVQEKIIEKTSVSTPKTNKAKSVKKLIDKKKAAKNLTKKPFDKVKRPKPRFIPKTIKNVQKETLDVSVKPEVKPKRRNSSQSKHDEDSDEYVDFKELVKARKLRKLKLKQLKKIAETKIGSRLEEAGTLTATTKNKVLKPKSEIKNRVAVSSKKFRIPLRNGEKKISETEKEKKESKEVIKAKVEGVTKQDVKSSKEITTTSIEPSNKIAKRKSFQETKEAVVDVVDSSLNPVGEEQNKTISTSTEVIGKVTKRKSSPDSSQKEVKDSVVPPPSQNSEETTKLEEPVTSPAQVTTSVIVEKPKEKLIKRVTFANASDSIKKSTLVTVEKKLTSIMKTGSREPKQRKSCIVNQSQMFDYLQTTESQQKKRLSLQEYNSRKRHFSSESDSNSKPVIMETQPAVLAKVPKTTTKTKPSDKLEITKASVKKLDKPRPKSLDDLTTTTTKEVVSVKRKMSLEETSFANKAVTLFDWEETQSPKRNPSKEESGLKEFSGLINSNAKSVIDINGLTPDPVKTDVLQVYKDQVDSKLSTISIQIPPKLVKNTFEYPLISLESHILMKRFLNNEKLTSDEMSKIEQIISYKRMMQHFKKFSQPQNDSPQMKPKYEIRKQCEPNQNDIKLHLKKVPIDCHSRSQTRFRNLYNESSSEDSDSDSASVLNASSGDYSVVQSNSIAVGVPKLIIKRSRSDMPQPIVRLERLDMNLIVKKRRYC